MNNLAQSVWPKDRRTSFCYSFRQGEQKASCNAKHGNPFGPFWDTFNVDFEYSEDYGPLHYDVHHTAIAKEWNEKYPAEEWPVLAFTGAPAAFPIQKENLMIQKHFVWNDAMLKKANDYIKENLGHAPFIGIHLRNGVDWVTRTPKYPY